VLEFLHQNRIFHGDLVEDNTVIGVLYSEVTFLIKGLRDPKSTQYALIDFGQSVKYSLDIPLEEVTESRPYNFGYHGLPLPPFPYNPFSLEVAVFGVILRRWSRVRVSQIKNFSDFILSLLSHPAY